jgi:hypothetical protein
MEFKMKTISTYFVLIILAVIMLICKVDSAFSQQPFPAQLYFYITEVYSEYYDDEIYSYYFIIDKSTVKELDKSLTIDELIVTTTYGDIIFSSDGLKNTDETLVLGNLKAPGNVQQFGIVKSVAKINGTFYDITNQLYIAKESIIPTVKLSEDNKACPSKVLDFIVAEGTFDSFECYDYCHTMIRVNGKMEDFFHESNLGYFFADEKNIGKKIKFNAEVRQFIRYEDETRSSFVCDRHPSITNLIVLSK